MITLLILADVISTISIFKYVYDCGLYIVFCSLTVLDDEVLNYQLQV